MENPRTRPHLKYAVAAALVRTGDSVLSLRGNLDLMRSALKGAALTATRTACERDPVYRFWNASHGGVYVQVSHHAPPTPTWTRPSRCRCGR